MKQLYYIPGFKNKYAINDRGEVYSYYTDKYLNPTVTPKGLKVTLLLKNKRISKMVHRLVATMFLDNPDNLPQVTHKNGNKEDNRVSNLVWTPYSNNYCNAKPSKKVFRAHITASQKVAIKCLYGTGTPVGLLSQALNVKVQTIYNILNLKKETYKGYAL